MLKEFKILEDIILQFILFVIESFKTLYNKMCVIM